MTTTTPTIAIIVSDMLLGKSYGQALVAQGFEVMVATNKAELDCYTEVVVDVLVLDNSLPAAFKQMAHTRLSSDSSKLVMLSSFGDKADIEEAKALGAIAYISKASTTPREFVEKLFNIITT